MVGTRTVPWGSKHLLPPYPSTSEPGTVFGYPARGDVTPGLVWSPLLAPVTFLRQSQPSQSAGYLPVPPVPYVPVWPRGCLRRRGPCRGALPIPGGPGAVPPLASLPGLLSAAPSASRQPFVPVAGRSPMTLSICRLTAGSPPSALAPFPIQFLPPQAPFPGCPARDLARVRRSWLPTGPKACLQEPDLTCRAERKMKVQAAQGSRRGPRPCICGVS